MAAGYVRTGGELSTGDFMVLHRAERSLITRWRNENGWGIRSGKP